MGTSEESVSQLTDRISFLTERIYELQKIESIGILIRGLAHDLNNLLFIIIGNSQLALSKIDCKDGYGNYDHYLNSILKAANISKDIICRLAMLSKPSEDINEYLHLQEIILDIVRFIRFMIPSSIEIRCNINDEYGMVFGNSTKIQQVLLNLCTNSFQALIDRKNGLIIIGLTKIVFSKNDTIFYKSIPGNYIQLSVKDNGCGIEKKNVSLLFEPYFTTKKALGGTGLGLSVVKEIVQSMGGFINVYSEIDKGTTFHLFFPEAINKSNSKVTKKSEIEEELFSYNKDNSKYLVYIIDDDASVSCILSTALEKVGYTFEICNDSQIAINNLRDNPNKYNLIISDLTMPGIKGDELASMMLEINPNIPIILCSGFTDIVIDKKISNIKYLLTKPISMLNLLNTVKTVINSIVK